jgi:trimeric autotransporter adhesin
MKNAKTKACSCIVLFILINFGLHVNAQNVGIGTNSPDASAKLEISSNNSGILIPRMTAAQRSTIATPATGLLVYQTDGSSGFWYYTGSTWIRIGASEEAWKTTGNSGTSNGANFLGTTDNQALDIQTNNVIRTRITTKGQIEVLNTGQSVFIGEGAGAGDDLSANANVLIGYMAGTSNTNGSNNVAVGTNALYTNNGNGNVGVGYDALNQNLLGLYNTGLGYSALKNNEAHFNTAIGSSALYNNTNGRENIAIGSNALSSNLGGSRNVAVGYLALYTQSFGSSTWYSSNVGIGYRALYSNQPSASTNGVHNVAIGSEALYSNTTGLENSATGYQVMFNNTTGYRNTASGYQALYSNIIGTYNVASGYLAMRSNTAGTRMRLDPMLYTQTQRGDLMWPWDMVH